MLPNVRRDRLGRILVPSLVVATVSAITPSAAWGQATTATILGTVADLSGATVIDAQVQVRNVATGILQLVATDSAGRFRVPDLGIGDYEVQASKQGFEAAVRKGITLTVGSEAVIDFLLPVGAEQQTVTVQAEASQGDELGCGRQRGGLGPDAQSAVERAQLRAIAHRSRNQFGANLGGPAKGQGLPFVILEAECQRS